MRRCRVYVNGIEAGLLTGNIIYLQPTTLSTHRFICMSQASSPLTKGYSKKG